LKPTIVYHDSAMVIEKAQADGEDLWILLDDLEKLAGWTLKPEGICKGDVCVPIPPGRESEFIRDAQTFNLAALARPLGETVVHSDDRSVWVFSEAAASLSGRLQSMVAPDFALPDLEGRIHQLSDYRGNKVFLVAWASW